MTLRLRSIALAVGLLLAPAIGHAEVDHQLFAAVAGGVWPSPSPGGHGVAILEWRARRAPGAGSFTLSYNTDTLRARFDDYCVGSVCLGVELAGEAFLAGLLSDYYRRGERVAELEFSASYVAATAFAEVRLPESWFLRYAVTGRRWFFADLEPPFEAPPEAWVAEQELALTYWQLEPDQSQWQPHRLFRRVRGLALGLRGGLHVRSEHRPWGDPARNDPAQVILLLRQWSAYGAQLHPRLRVQVEQRFGWGHREDDLTRDRLGGLNPYVVPIGGLPWAAFLSGRYASGRLSAHVRTWGDVEAGVFFDAAALPDTHRDGGARFGGAVGTGAFVDARFGPWQADLWLAWAPGLTWGLASGYFGGFVAVGRTF